MPRGMTRTSLHAALASPIQAYLEQLHERFAGLSSGQVASYIPELAKADPAAFGIVIATVDGQVYGGRCDAPAVHDAVDLEAAGLWPCA